MTKEESATELKSDGAEYTANTLSEDSSKIAEMKNRRKYLRKQITEHKNLTFRKILENGSRSFISMLLKKVENLNKESQKITQDVAIEIDPFEAEKECIRQDEYDDEVLQLKTAVNNYLRSREKDPASDIVSLAENNNSESDSDETLQNPHMNEIKPKPNAVIVPFQSNNVVVPSYSGVPLPKWEIKPFDGDLLQFQSFWQQFETCVDSHPELPEVRKFSYLLNSLRGSARKLIEGFPLTAEAYQAAKTHLLERYGQQNEIKIAHLNKLKELQFTKPAHDVKALSALYDEVNVHVRALESIGVPIHMYGYLLTTILMQKMPRELLKDWTKDSTRDCNDLKLLLKFIFDHIRAEERCQLIRMEQRQNRQESFQKTIPQRNTTSALVASESQTEIKKLPCLFCESTDHRSNDCSFDLMQRKQCLRQQGRCFVCLRKNHWSTECQSKKSCTQCKQKHHWLICNAKTIQKSSDIGASQISPVICATGHSSDQSLATAAVQVKGPKGILKIRCLFDSGSSQTYITQSVAEELGLKIKESKRLKVGRFGGGHKVMNSFQVLLEVCSLQKETKPIEIVALTFPKICEPVPTNHLLPVLELLSENGLTPAEDLDELRSKGWDGTIDLLIGTKHFWKFLTGNTKRLEKDLMAMESIFGWIAHGDTCMEGDCVNVHSLIATAQEEFNVPSEDETGKMLNKLYEIGSNDGEDIESIWNHPIVNEFENTINFENGRYVVGWPWKDTPFSLPTNDEVVSKMAWSLLNRLKKTPERLEAYNAQFAEYEEKGFIECLGPNPQNGERVHVLSHHPVIREDKQSTKIRPVLNASFGNPSLNKCLHAGPNLNAHMGKLLIRFRSKRVAVTGDIEKAFLQLVLKQEDRDSVRFVWFRNFNSSRPEKVYFRFTRVVFGVTSSPFLLAATLKYHAKKYLQLYPKAAQALIEDTFVDDVITGGDTEEEVFGLAENIVKLAAEGGFNLRRLRSNRKEVMASLLKQFNEPSPNSDISTILGMMWNLSKDEVGLDLSFIENVLKRPRHRTSMRVVLSVSSQLYDPIGFVSPVVITARLLIQDAWIRRLQWDEELPKDMRDQFWNWVDQLPNLLNVQVPRWFGTEDNNDHIELHVFGDASIKAYGAVAYMRCVTNNVTTVHFVCSRARVAPVKDLTLARKELLAAELATELAVFVKSALKRKDLSTIFWSDSKVALHWINGDLSRWKQYVANRVKKIRNRSSLQEWRHVAGTQNPADMCSRGASANVFPIQDCLWWRGPEWLILEKEFWPPQSDVIQREFETREDVQMELKKTICLLSQSVLAVSSNSILNIERYSLYHRLIRETAIVLRKFANAILTRLKKPERKGIITPQELVLARNYWIRQIQYHVFKREIRDLKINNPVNKKSNIHSFQPSITKDEIIVFKGRMGKILPILPGFTDGSVPHFIMLVIREAHLRLLHAGVSDVLTELREWIWITNPKKAISSVIRKCVVCKKIQGKLYQQTTGPLPPDRTEIGEPFEVTGVDFAGPLFLKSNEKCWFCLFTCGKVRAVHIELVPSMSADSFFLALKRFIARRGIPRVIYSDNASTFKLVSQEVKIRKQKQKSALAKLTDLGIEWKFIPEYAPWWGGFWERLVGLVKRHLKKALGNAKLTYEEMVTLLTQIEAVVNSRPITYVYEDQREPEPLTPSHFLISKRLTSMPSSTTTITIDEKTTVTKQELTRRMCYRDKLLQQYWTRWSKEYLQERNRQFFKIHKNQPIKIGEVVLIKEENIPREKWKMGRIVQLIEGRDGLVRAVMVKTASGTGKRAVQNLCSLEVEGDSEKKDK